MGEVSLKSVFNRNSTSYPEVVMIKQYDMGCIGNKITGINILSRLDFGRLFYLAILKDF